MASWPPSIIHQPTSVGAVFFILPVPSRFHGPGRTPLGLFPVRKNTEVPHFKRFLIHLSVPLLLSTCFATPPRRPNLSGRHRQRLHPPHHRSEQPARQVALRQQ